MRIGLFGGTFDPVHVGHLLLAQTAKEQLGLDRILFIPAAQSPFKPDQKFAPAAERLRLLHLALAGRSDFEIDTQEIDRGGTSYTIDTIRECQNKFPTAKLLYLIGADNATHLPKWREANELADRVDFAVIPRPGQTEIEIPAPFRGSILRGFSIGISSSEIRGRVRQGLPIDQMVTPAVAEAIRNYRLYL
jgi:nicotinate-nucleotide adenylyltransferase